MVLTNILLKLYAERDDSGKVTMSVKVYNQKAEKLKDLGEIEISSAGVYRLPGLYLSNGHWEFAKVLVIKITETNLIYEVKTKDQHWIREKVKHGTSRFVGLLSYKPELHLL